MSATPIRCWVSSPKLRRDGHAESQHYESLVANWRVATIATQTVDEYGVLFRNLFAMDKIEVKGVHGIIISSVVPPLDSTLRQVCERYFNTRPLFIEPGVKTGMPVLYDNPAEVGADRIVNSVAAFEKFGGPCIVVDFGTATTFDCVSAKGEYMGGVICPGIGISADALFQKTARLPRVAIRKPARVIGTHHRRQPAVRALLWLPRTGGRHSRAVAGRNGRGNHGRRHRRTGRPDRKGIEIHQARGRFADSGRPASHLGTEHGGEVRA